MQTDVIIDKRQLLADHYLFGPLGDLERNNILALAIERHYANGQVIFQKGEEGSSMMIVLRGEVKIGVISQEGREIVLNTIREGEVFGEIALLDGKARSADAIAVGECLVLLIRRRDFLPYLEKNTTLAVQLIGLLCQKLRDTSSALENMGLLGIPARLARLLLKMSEADQIGKQKVLRVTRKLSQKQIGNLIGATRESVNKQLRAWQMEGILQQDAGWIMILRVSELTMIAEAG